MYGHHGHRGHHHGHSFWAGRRGRGFWGGFDFPGGPGGFRGGPGGDGPWGDDAGPRFRRGDVKWALLELIVEKPRHGYELIKELERRAGGFYRPSAGAVYPTLQMLEEGGFMTSAPVDGKKVYTVTDAGRKLLDEHKAEHGAHRHGEDAGRDEFPSELHELRRLAMLMAGAVMQAARGGDPKQMRQVLEVLDRARKEIYAILGEDAGDAP